MKYYIEQIKKFKYLSKDLKHYLIIDLLRNLAFMLLGIGLYLWLNNTGLLIYLIFMTKYHWMTEEE